MDRLEWQPDVSVGDWIAEHLRSLGGTVGSTVPPVFEAYARILHPAETSDGQQVAWAQVCTETGATAHALMQWRAVSRTETVPLPGGSVTDRSAWDGLPPEVGSLPVSSLRALVEVLAGHSADRQCVFALWEGHGWIDGRRSLQWWTDADGVRTYVEPSSAFPVEVLDGPRLRLPGRDHLLFAGDLAAADALGDPHGAWPQSPNLFWPGDRSWCVATEIDFDSTVVGGSPALVAQIIGSAALEAWPVGPTASLTFDADRVNPLPDSGRDHRSIPDAGA